MKYSTHYSISVALLSVMMSFSACSDDYDFRTPGVEDGDAVAISLAGQIKQEMVSRANDDGFVDGDVIGAYVVDYEGENPGTLLAKGNRGDNVHFTFDEAASRWNPSFDMYWKDKHTRIDVYSYYPASTVVDNVSEYQFAVLTDQNASSDDGTMGGYEASDFLWGKVPGVEPTSNVIRIPLAHRMANARITLVEGEGFDAGEWAETVKQVLVSNTIQTSVIDMNTGVVTPVGEVSDKAIIPARHGDEWRAIVVPQSIKAGTTLFTLSVGGMPYKFSKNEDFTYVAGKMSNFSIRVDKKLPEGQYALTLISESITAWENDLVSHDATSREYIVINSTPGGLRQAIADAGQDYKLLQNLKITGEINAEDFKFMRNEMTRLKALNLKEVRIKSSTKGTSDDVIPSEAMRDKATLRYLVLPDYIKGFEYRSFHGSGLVGSLIIPEGVEEIGLSAFQGCANLTGSLFLPTTLKTIGYSAFEGCGFTCEISLPDNVEEIGDRAFFNCRNLYGGLRLPQRLKILGGQAFSQCLGLSGSLEIPQGVTEIKGSTFHGCNFGGTLTLHDGVTMIARNAFYSCYFKGELALPKNLEVIEDGAFYGNNFSGELKLPQHIVSIGVGAFCLNSRLTGTIEFGDEVISIGQEAFSGCRHLENVVFSRNIETIGPNAFKNCLGIGSIVCKGEMPALVMPGAFDGVAKDNFTLEVPETSVALYQTKAGWCDFKRIAAHHELVCRPSVACALDSEHKQTLVIDAEGDWEVASMPDWCQLSQTSGSKKTELTLTIKACAKDRREREGEIVFLLKDKEYSHSCHVRQYGYVYGEDEYLTLQRATKGNTGGINIVILGDGYDAADIASGAYLQDMRQEVEYFFGIEPYNTYRDYFNVYTAFPLSTESGVGSVNTIRYNRFNTTYTHGVGLKCDYDEVFSYALNAPTVDSGNLDETLIIIVPNSTDYGGICQMWTSGAAIAFCPKSDYDYPLDSRGVIQHEAGGHGFAKLADEYIYHNTFIDVCPCSDGCGHDDDIKMMKAWGWYDNLELTGKIHEVGWSHLIFDPRYSDIVDIFEGGFKHSRGVFRSEQNSCMNNNIPYFSTISRESIVKRIKRYAGETYDFEDFVANDNRNTQVASRSFDGLRGRAVSQPGFEPVIHKGSPLDGLKKSGKK